MVGPIISFDGDLLPVSAFPVDGTFPTATTQWEKRNLALEIPVWETDLCIQCGKCVMVCPHAVIRHKVYDEKLLEEAPASFKSMPSKFKEFSQGLAYTVQIAPEDCTGCTLCVEVCPVKDKSRAGRKAHQYGAAACLAGVGGEKLGLLYVDPGPGSKPDQPVNH